MQSFDQITTIIGIRQGSYNLRRPFVAWSTVGWFDLGPKFLQLHHMLHQLSNISSDFVVAQVWHQN